MNWLIKVGLPFFLSSFLGLLSGSLLSGQVASTSPSQTNSNTSTPSQSPAANASASTAQTFSGPLSDFVPCLFSSDQEFDMHAIQRPAGGLSSSHLDEGTIFRLIRTTSTALDESIVSAFQRTGPPANSAKAPPSSAENPFDASEYALKVVNDYEARMQKLAPALTSKTPDEVLLIALQTANDSLLSVRTQYNKLPAGAPNLSQVETAARGTFGSTGALAVAAATQSSPFRTPNDVSCSIAILTWQETSDTFGRRVANEYIGIQVTVRNLNTTNEFLIHDIQVAVDIGLDSASFSRFQAGRDKLLVRAVAQRGQSEDRRNVVLHSLEAIGAIAGSSSILGSRDFETAVAVFQSAFIPAYTSIFPDHTVEHINHINDLVFSASATNKVLVPIQGSVPLVTFVSEKPIEELPFAWCGYNSSKSLFHKKRQTYCDAGNYADASQQTERSEASSYPDRYSLGDAGTLVKNKAISDPSSALFPLAWDNLHYKNWKAAALRILQQRTFVVIGGVHIKEVTTQLGKLNGLNCPILPSGSIDISTLQNGKVVCSATGTNLDAAASVLLEKDTQKIAGTIKPGKDGNTADIQFDPAILSDGDGMYRLMLVDKTGAELDSGESVKLEIQPQITSADSALDLSTTDPTITLHGKNLDKLALIWLVTSDGSSPLVQSAALPTAPAASKTIVVSFSGAKLAKDAQYFVRYTSLGDANSIDLKSVVVKTSGSAPPEKPSSAGAKPANSKGPAAALKSPKVKPKAQAPH